MKLRYCTVFATVNIGFGFSALSVLMASDANTLPGYWLNETSDEFHQLKHYLLMSVNASNNRDNIEYMRLTFCLM